MTEKSGRVHTSAVSVAILPQADQVQASQPGGGGKYSNAYLC